MLIYRISLLRFLVVTYVVEYYVCEVAVSLCSNIPLLKFYYSSLDSPMKVSILK